MFSFVGGGCTESPAAQIITPYTSPEGVMPPIGTPVSQSIISLSWNVPQFPNGPNLRYEITKQTFSNPLSGELIVLYLIHFHVEDY